MLRLYYYKDARGNFGDDLNLWLWPQILPNTVDIDNPFYAFSDVSSLKSRETLFVGIGSLLNHQLPTGCDKVILGAGYGYGRVPVVDDRWKVFAVRGPISAKILQIDPALSITDSAVLVRNLPLPSVKKKYRCSFFAYHETAEIIQWRHVCRAIGMNYIDPSKSVDSILLDIRESEIVLCEAMHAAIVADALRVPWIPVKIFHTINELNWQDWCESIDLRYNPVTLAYLKLHKDAGYSKTFLNKARTIAAVCKKLFRIGDHTEPILSSDESIGRVTDRMNEKLYQVQKIYR
jgi:succinoglycan biosynthesis protein ExoV